jgi:hypothetical protein
MTGRNDEDRARRGAELAARSLRARNAAAELVAESEELAHRFAEARKAGARVMQHVSERRTPGTAAGTREDPPGGSPAREVPDTPLGPGAGMLDASEAATLAALLEELAARVRRAPRRARALAAAALLRQRVAAAPWHGLRPWPGGPQVRREAGDTRDDCADDRDTLAAERDRRADDRDDRSAERDRMADDAAGQARAAEQYVRDLLWEAELRDKDAAAQAAAQLSAIDGSSGQLDRERAEAGRARNQQDREAIREMLAQADAGRQAARHGRYADGQDRVASLRDRSAAQIDRQAATADRQAARADRDQAVVETEQEDPPGTGVPGI